MHLRGPRLGAAQKRGTELCRTGSSTEGSRKGRTSRDSTRRDERPGDGVAHEGEKDEQCDRSVVGVDEGALMPSRFGSLNDEHVRARAVRRNGLGRVGDRHPDLTSGGVQPLDHRI